MQIQSLSRRQWLGVSCATGVAALGGSGCSPKGSTTPAATNTSESVVLRVLVVDDAPLGEAIQREWHSRTEREVKIEAVSAEKLSGASRLPGDVIVFPSAWLGHLAERSLIRPLGESLLSGESVAWQDIFPLVRRDELAWGGKTYSLPVGTPQLVLAYRTDLLARLKLDPPQTWDDYHAAAVKLDDSAALGDVALAAGQPWRGAVEPIGTGFGGALLLARAAAYASHREQISPLMELSNCEPLIDRPPFVRALTELTTLHNLSDQPSIASPVEAMAELLAGRCAMAIGYPDGKPAPSGGKSLPISFAELPGSSAVFNFGQNQWEQRRREEDARVPFLGTAGRLAAVASSTSHIAAAEGMVGWLAGAEVSSRIGPASSGAAIFRASHRDFLKQWVGTLPGESAQRYFDVVRQGQSRARSLTTVRLPLSTRYMAALDSAVQRATGDGQNPHEALTQAADEWRKITADVGVANQRTALANSVGAATR